MFGLHNELEKKIKKYIESKKYSLCRAPERGSLVTLLYWSSWNEDFN